MSDATNGGERGHPRRPVPIAHEHERPFWVGGARGELMVQRCRECGGLNHPPTMRCRHDHCADLVWTVLSGRGHVEGWSVTQHQWLPDFPTPYVVALVALAEDSRARVLTNLVNVDPDAIHHGMAVQVTFVQPGASGDDAGDDDVWIPLFEPAADR